MSKLLEVCNLTAGYGRLKINRKINLVVNAGEVVLIIGPNGAGKSTLLKAVFGLIKCFEGTVLWRGREICHRPTYQRIGSGLSYVPQVENIFPSLTVREHLELLARGHSAPERIAAAVEIFPDLQNMLSKRAGSLSGGQRQMVAIGMALIPQPELVLLDEPSAGLSPRHTDNIFGQIAKLSAHGVTVLMVEQNAKKALAISDRCYVLAAGKNVFDDRADRVLQNKKIGELYLGNPVVEQ